MALIISAYPGCGKSYTTNYLKEHRPDLIVLDSDSSYFSWIWKNGVKTEERNPDFPNNYIQHIKDNMNTANIIFVSSHKNVREALINEHIRYMLVYPDKSMKEEFMQRYKNRGSSEEFIKFQSDNWDKFIDECENEDSIKVDKFKLTHETPNIYSMFDF